MIHVKVIARLSRRSYHLKTHKNFIIMSCKVSAPGAVINSRSVVHLSAQGATHKITNDATNFAFRMTCANTFVLKILGNL